MAVLTAAYDAKRKDGKLLSYPMAAGAKIFKGSLVSVTSSSGLVAASADAAGTVFVGVAYETVDNTGGAAGAKSIRLEKSGVFTFPAQGGAQTDVGKAALIIDSNTVKTAATTNSVAAGVVTGFLSAALLAVRIDGKAS